MLKFVFHFVKIDCMKSGFFLQYLIQYVHVLMHDALFTLLIFFADFLATHPTWVVCVSRS